MKVLCVMRWVLLPKCLLVGLDCLPILVHEEVLVELFRVFNRLRTADDGPYGTPDHHPLPQLLLTVQLLIQIPLALHLHRIRHYCICGDLLVTSAEHVGLSGTHGHPLGANCHTFYVRDAEVRLELQLLPLDGRFVFAHFVSESVPSLVRPLLVLVDAVDGLGILVLDLDNLGGILDRHVHVDELDQFGALLVRNFRVLSSH